MQEDLINRLMLIMEHYELTSNAFAKKSGIDSSNFNKMLSGIQKITQKTIRKIGITFPYVNIDWLMTGNGEMLRKNFDTNVTMLGHAVPEIRENLVEVKFYEVTPSATFKEYCQGMAENPGSVTIMPMAGENLDDTYCVFKIHGESMAPQIQDGAAVLCREIPPTRWHTLNDCVVVIAYGEKFVIKRIAKNLLDAENYLVLQSDNPDAPAPHSENAQLADIRCIFKAERIISQRIY